ncbi:MAG: hypothetical protein J6Y28_02175 [Acholeplasmatales bacterium]|nr:hypothetical protein [Acholeplasmatales bacterium]
MKKLLLVLFIFFLFGCTKKKEYKKDNDYIYFGSYPQVIETNKDIINKLNNKVITPTKTNFNNWNSYEYYLNDKMSNYMFYIDINLNNEKYRGIYLLDYRPFYTFGYSESDSYQVKNGYLINNIYWFKYGKIKWNIIDEKDGKYKLISNLILDSQEYYPKDIKDEFEHNGSIGYSNNYELSSIRKWLNNNFYNIAFKNSEKKIINDMLVDNSNSSSDGISSTYLCNNTLDKVTILSYNEAFNLFNESERRCSSTDYSLSQGLFNTSNGYNNYHLRTPSSFNPNNSYYIDYDGAIHGDGQVIKGYVYNTSIGVRPVITISI